MKYSVVLCCLFFLCWSCVKDNGNYNYTPVNEITVTDSAGNSITNSTYNIKHSGDLYIQPVVTGSLPDFDVAKLEYAWIIAGDTVSRSPILKIKGADIGTGKKYGKLVVTDLSTSASYSYNFNVNISASISKGSFILTADETNQAYVTTKDLTSGEYEEVSQLGEYKLGTNPVKIDLGYRATSSVDRTYMSLMVTTRDGVNPVMVANVSNLEPYLLYPKSTAAISGKTFTPSYTLLFDRLTSSNDMSGYTVVNGKAHTMAFGVVSEDVFPTDPLDYNVGDNAIVPSSILRTYFTAIYDNKNQRIRLFGNNVNSRSPDVFNRDYNELIKPAATTGHSFVAAAEFFTSDWIFQFITRKDNDMYMHNIVMQLSTPYQPKSFTTSGPKNFPGLDKAVSFKYHGGLNFWYFALGRTIYRFSSLGLDIQPYITLPDDGSGDITTWNFNINSASSFSKIGIATYNPSAAGVHKGSYYIYDIASGTYDSKDLNVIRKAVDIAIGL